MGVRSTNPLQSFSDDFSNSGTEALRESQIFSPITATGGDTVLTITGYKVHIYTTEGAATFEVQSGGGEVEYLVVAGGGSGSAQYGGGGGAGGLRTNLSGHPLAGAPLNVQPGTTSVVVGKGGAFAEPPGMPGVSGSDSSITSSVSTIVASGGGGGGGPMIDSPSGFMRLPFYTTSSGAPGGSGGGGAGRIGSNASYAGGSGNKGGFPTPTREGYPGGAGIAPGPRAGGGGGGAGAAGQDGTSSDAGDGGVGVQVLIAGNPSPIGVPGPSGDGWFAGGGGASGYNINAGDGKTGGGNGRTSPTAGLSGTDNTGGGGGGGYHPGATTGGNGGPGIVVIRYPTS